MHYGKNVSKTQADYILEHLSLPDKEEVLGVFDAGLYRLLFITSNRLIDVFSYKVSVEVAGNNIASVTNSKLFGLSVTLRSKIGRIKTVLLPVKQDDRVHVLGLLDAIKAAPTPVSQIVDKSSEKWVLGVRVKANILGAKKDHDRINKIAAKEKSAAKHELKAATKSPEPVKTPAKLPLISSLKERRAAEKSKEEAKLQELQQRAQEAQQKAEQELHNDRVIVVATVIDLLKEHWLTLSMRHSQTVSNDGYNNYRIDPWITELTYFRDNVVMQKLDEMVAKETVNKQLGKILLIIFAGGVKDLNTDDMSFGTPSRELAAVFMNRPEITDMRGSVINSWGQGLDGHTLTVAYEEALSIPIRSLGVSAKDPNVKYDMSQLDIVTTLIFTLVSWLYQIGNSGSSGSATIALPTNPYDYEAYVANRLSAMGFTAQTTKRSGDYGVDVLAEKNGKTYAIQCKYYTSPVGLHAVQEIHAGQVYYKADYAAVVTNSTFTPAAKKLAATSQVLLLNDSGLESLNIIAGHSGEARQQDSPGKPAPNTVYNPADEIARKKQIADELITVILPSITNK